MARRQYQALLVICGLAFVLNAIRSAHWSKIQRSKPVAHLSTVAAQLETQKWWKGKEWWRGKADVHGASHPHLGARLLYDHTDRDVETAARVNNVVSVPTVFYCKRDDGNAFGEARAIFEAVLPEYQWVQCSIRNNRDAKTWRKRLLSEGRNNPSDFFLMPLGLACDSLTMMFLLDDFRGSMLYVSGESLPVGGYLPERMKGGSKFLIGPTMVKSDWTFTLTYLQMTWWGLFRPMYGGDAVLLDAAHRPRGVQPDDNKGFLVYAASNCVGFRDEAYVALSSIGPAYHGGKCRGGGRDRTNRTAVKSGISLKNWKDNVAFYSQYRFCLVMEHIYQEAYVTEKILMAFLGGCIPIYWGSKMVKDIFNPEAFIYYNITDPEPALRLVQSLEENRTAYTDMLGRPILAGDANETIADYFGFADDVGAGGRLRDRIRRKLGVDKRVRHQQGEFFQQMIVDPSTKRLFSPYHRNSGHIKRKTFTSASIDRNVLCPGPFPGIEGRQGNTALLKIRDNIANPNRPTPTRKSRILCMVYTVDSPESLSNLRGISETWAPKCDGFIAASNSTNHRVGSIDLPHLGPEVYGNMWQKIRTMWSYAYDHYLDEFDFFHIAGDDAYIVVENLRAFVDGPDVARLEAGYLDEIARKQGRTIAIVGSQQPLIIGRPMFHRKQKRLSVFPAGGSGYTLNRAALDLFGRIGSDSYQSDVVDAREDVFVGSFFHDEGVYLSHDLDQSGGHRYGGSAESMARHHKGKPTLPGNNVIAKFGLKPRDYLDGVSKEYVAFHLKHDKKWLKRNNQTCAELMHRYHAVLYDLC